MDVLAVDQKWLLKCVSLWEPSFLKKQLRNLPPALDFTSLDWVEAEAWEEVWAEVLAEIWAKV